MKRIVSEEVVWCEHCGCLPDQFIKYDRYDDSGVWYCSSCMYANGDIDETQVKTDDLDNLKMYKSFLAKEMRAVDEKIAEFFGHTLDNED
jgi:hypothetical protein